MTQLNRDLLAKIADAIEAEPRRWHQDEWFSWLSADEQYHKWVEDTTGCNTAFCVAGWAVNIEYGIRVYRDCDGASTLMPVGGPISNLHWSEMAAEALGLTAHQAEVLFAFYTFAGDVDLCVSTLRELADGAPFDDHMKIRMLRC